MAIIFKEQKQIPREQLKALYEDAQWYAYTKDMDELERALSCSLYVLSAWEKESLVGLIRVVGDGLTIIYIQDILVLTNHQNQGIATDLMSQTLVKFGDVRQKVLLTEEAPNVRHFYAKIGFSSCDAGTLVAFAKID
ncbi:GNAT family N-acetyltransferase [Planococcus sp. CP5-4]|uniref:GNAT family N-acetyltransferase n=1 Tax=unclassified Planococcus (in: firmicutes) TaxID=2662419 RepID=UPI001C21E072|nr:MULTISPECIES: GNAT family N-acetyltransferase [unclassified Planococcus (in: firmicutes)]MBU9674510.1 GNAT family N-acetyltransferase [Planococcus sp. CP5-4_YE]MBV0910141.1 GNAT family N-acetyltransferase [Planococcus sp. CP5-4_UN]MBW6064652.1 GNAT family N-acetyltransferase [Planococcus sp. CP5-4]